MANFQSSEFLSRYPKERPPLPQAYQLIYNEHYANNRQGATKVTSLSSRLERWLHKTVAADVRESKADPETLEIGAGTLNHLPYEPGISRYDVVEPFDFLFGKGENAHRVRNKYRDIRDIPQGQKYDRILSIATFEHLTDLPAVVAYSSVLLTGKGVLRVSIPNEGTIMWKLGTRLTGMEFRKIYGLDYQILMRHEHVNAAREVESVLRYFFSKVRARNFGPHKSLAFYRFFECQTPDISRAEAYLKTQA